MAKTKAQERTTAQPQATRFFNTIGWSQKERDGIQCPHCFRMVIPHTSAGIADLSGTVNGRGFICEVKDGAERFPFAERDADQRQFAHEWEYYSYGISLVWLLMGTGRAGHVTAEYPRTTFLLPSQELERVEYILNEFGGVKNLPLNALAADTRIATRNHQLYAIRLLSEYRLSWVGGRWWPDEDHFIWQAFDIDPYKTRKAA